MLTLAVAAVGVQPHTGGATLHITGKLVGVLVTMAAIAWVAYRHIDRIGRTKAWVYVGLVALFSTAAGMAFGAWKDGVSLWLLGGGLGLFLLALAAALYAIHRRTPTMTKAA